jgi:uncharacterized membrane protein
MVPDRDGPRGRRDGWAGGGRLPRGGGTSRLLLVALTVKGVDGALELVAAALVLLVPRSVVESTAAAIVARDVVGPPGGALARAVTAGVTALEAQTVLVAVYLALHGVVKVALVVALVRRRVRFYPAAVVVLGLLVVVELERAVRTGSALLAGLAVLDALIIAVVVREYRSLRRGRPGHYAAPR